MAFALSAYHGNFFTCAKNKEFYFKDPSTDLKLSNIALMEDIKPIDIKKK